MKKITITRALSEINLLEKKIEKQISNLNVVGIKSNQSELVKGTEMNVDEFKTDVQSDYKKLTNLMKKRDEIKRALIQSNAVTKVKLGDKEYTVAELIEKKQSIRFSQMLLNALKRQYVEAQQEVDRENNKIENEAKRLQESFVTNSKENNKNVVEQSEALFKQALDSKKFQIINPMDISKTIDELQSEIDEFEMEVDFILSESNAKTEIEVSE